MQRVIKFRGKVIAKSPSTLEDLTGQWVHGGYFYNADDDMHFIRTNEGGVYEIDRQTLGQNIGLSDKSETEIYEGDILKTDKVDSVMLVMYSPRYASFSLFKSGWMYNHYFGEACEASDCEIIGNKHDNTELLKTQ